MSWLTKDQERWLESPKNQDIINSFDEKGNPLRAAVLLFDIGPISRSEYGNRLSLEDCRHIYLALWYLKYGVKDFLINISIDRTGNRDYGMGPIISATLVIGGELSAPVILLAPFELTSRGPAEEIVKSRIGDKLKSIGFSGEVIADILHSVKISINKV